MALSELALAERIIINFNSLPASLRGFVLGELGNNNTVNKSKSCRKFGFKSKNSVALSKRIVVMVNDAGRPVTASDVAKYFSIVKSTAHEHLNAIIRSDAGILRERKGREFIYTKGGM
jgi:hypothetical protein